MLLPLIVLSVLGLTATSAEAAELIEVNATTRALGLGNAFVSQAVDSEALFYNPAGLVRADGMTWRILGLKLGLNGPQALDFVQSFMNASDTMQAVQENYGKSLWLGGGAITAFTAPYFGFAVYDNFSSSFMIGNPASPSINLSSYNDFGYVGAFAIPILPMLHAGLSLKYIRRFGTQRTFSAGAIADLDLDEVRQAFLGESRGYALDYGMNFVMPGPVSPILSFVWKDIGSTSFRPVGGNTVAPPRQRDEMIVGAAVDVDVGLVTVRPELNLKYLNREDVQLGRKIHFGVEVGLPILDLRAGFNQGYYTLGAGMDLGLFRLDAATYGVEMGEYPGQLEDRRYMVEMTLELGLGSSIWSGGGASGGGSVERGLFGGKKRLKQRR